MKVHYHNLDGLRGIAALSVLLFHCIDVFHGGPMLGHGYLAVDLFFMLSGFVIALNYEQRLCDSMSLKTFLWRRARRLLPIYWMGLFFCTLLAILIRRFSPSILTGHFLSASVLLPCLYARGFAFPINPASWSLFTEWCANLLFAAIGYRLKSRWLLLAMLIGWGSALLWIYIGRYTWLYGDQTQHILQFALMARTIPAFFAGVLICRYRNHPRLQRLPVIAPQVIFCLWLVIASVPNRGPSPIFNICMVVFATPLLILHLLRSEQQAPKWCKNIGRLSYPLYASHLGITITLEHYLHHPSPLRGIITVVLALAVAWGIARGNDYIQAWITAHATRIPLQGTGTETIGSPRLH